MAFDLDAYSRAHKSRLARIPAQKRVTVSTGLAVRCVTLQQVYQHTFLWPRSPPRKVDAAHRNCWTITQLFFSTTGVEAGLQVQGIPVRYRHNVGVLFTPRKPSVKSQQLASVVSKFDSKAIVW